MEKEKNKIVELEEHNGPEMKPLTAKGMNDDGAKNLAGAVVEQLVSDYKLTLTGIKADPKDEELWDEKDIQEKDFRSPEIKLMTSLVSEKLDPLDPNKMIEAIKKRCKFDVPDPRPEKKETVKNEEPEEKKIDMGEVEEEEPVKTFSL